MTLGAGERAADHLTRIDRRAVERKPRRQEADRLIFDDRVADKFLVFDTQRTSSGLNVRQQCGQTTLRTRGLPSSFEGRRLEDGEAMSAVTSADLRWF